MKQVTNMSRLVNQLEKMFRALNADFFDNALAMPIITVTPSSRSYAHYTPWDAWQTADSGRREINIASGTLDRPLESIAGSLLHEMVHMYNDTVLNVQDTSRGGTYHSKVFKEAAETHGLLVERTEKYGWARTAPADCLLEWLLDHDELREVELCRVDPGCTVVGIGTRAPESGSTTPATPARPNHNHRYVCPCCHAIARSGKPIHLICGDCLTAMLEA
jgi:hypothetical protein